jgi:hypothetical protein
MATIILRNRTVFDGFAGEAVPGQDILIVDDRIEAVSDRLGLTPYVMETLAAVNRAGLRMPDVCLSAGARMGFGTDLMGGMEGTPGARSSRSAGGCSARSTSSAPPPRSTRRSCGRRAARGASGRGRWPT